jgi:hypothetical protein
MTAGPPSDRLPSIGAGLAAWYEHQPDDSRAVWILLALFVPIWTLFQVIAFSPVCLHGDILEQLAWSRYPAAGYDKHPPLGPLLAAAWFAVFPIATWSLELLAAVNAAVALFAVDLIARRFVAGDRRLLVLLLLLLTPFYQFHSQRFNPNAMLLSTWPIATYCFLRAFETRRPGWSIMAGATAALAMLAKYYSIYLIAGFVVAALTHPRRGDYLRSPSPWLSILAGLAALAPHLYWLAMTGATPFHYALTKHAAASLAHELKETLAYAAGGIGYVSLAVAAYLVAVRPDRRLLAAALWPSDPDQRMLVLLLAVPLLLPLLTAPIIGVTLTSLWTMSAWFLLPIVLLAPAQFTVTRSTTMRVAFAVIIVTAVVFVAAPVVAWNNFAAEAPRGRVCRVAIDALTRAWRASIGQPLTLVVGDGGLSWGATLYSPDHPDAAPFGLPTPPRITDARRAREGFAVVCSADDRACLDMADRETAGRPGVVRVEKELTASFFGLTSATARVVFTLVPPQP